MSENDFECFARTGVNTPETILPNWRDATRLYAPRNSGRAPLWDDALYGFTVKSAALLVTVPEDAVMHVAWEAVTLCPVATPVLAIVAALVFDDVQVTESVITTALPSSSVPVTMNA